MIQLLALSLLIGITNILTQWYLKQFISSDKAYLYVDVGGGSTELSVFSATNLVASKSFDIGTIRILDKKVKPENWIHAKEWLKKITANHPNLTASGTGGNINKIYRLANLKEGESLSTKKFNQVSKQLQALTLEQRIVELGLKPDRADVIVPACEIYANLFKWGNVKETIVPSVGLVDGIIQLLIEKNLGNQYLIPAFLNRKCISQIGPINKNFKSSKNEGFLPSIL